MASTSAVSLEEGKIENMFENKLETPPSFSLFRYTKNPTSKITIIVIMAMIIMGSMVLTRKMDKDASDVSSIDGGRSW